MKHTEKLFHLKGEQLLEEVYLILDSHIQYIEYQAQMRFSFKGKSSVETNHSSSGSSDSLVSNFDRMLRYIGELNQSKKLLQTLRSWLCHENAYLILNLLNNQRYLAYTEENLETMLRKRYRNSLQY